MEPLRRAATLWEAIAEPDIEARYELARNYTLLAAAAADSRSGLSAAYTAATADRAVADLPGRRRGLSRPGQASHGPRPGAAPRPG